MLAMKAIMAAGSASRLKKGWLCMGGASNGSTGLFSNLMVMNREHRERPAQAKKRTGKPKWLMRSIPK
jgi:hypothetical protein